MSEHHQVLDLTPTPFHHTGSPYNVPTSPPPPWRFAAGSSSHQRYYGYAHGPQLLGHEKPRPRSIEEAVGGSQSLLLQDQDQESMRTSSHHALSSSSIGHGYDQRPHSQHTLSPSSHHTLSSSPAPTGSVEYQNGSSYSYAGAEYTHRSNSWHSHWDPRPDLALPAPPNHPVSWLPPPPNSLSSPVGWRYQPPAAPPPPNSRNGAVMVDPVPQEPMLFSYHRGGGGYQLPILRESGKGQGIFFAPIVLGDGHEPSSSSVGDEEVEGHETSVQDAQMRSGLEDERVVFVSGKAGSTTGATPAPVDVSNIDPVAMILTDAAVLGHHAGSPTLNRSGGGRPTTAPRKSRINDTPKQAGIQQTPSITSGPLPADRVKVTEDTNGNTLLSFTYSLQRHKTLYTILTDISSCPPPSGLSEDFKKDHCVYPKAVVSDESEYKGVRWRYETECNRLAWGLCWVNPCLRGRRGLIQRAVDSWRNKEPGMRSRRIKKAAKRMADEEDEVGNPKKAKVVTELTKIPVLGGDVDQLGSWEALAAGIPEREVEVDTALADGAEEAEVIMKTVHKKTGPKYLLMADPLRPGARVRVKVLVSHVNLVAIPDDFRRKHCLFRSAFGINREDLDEVQKAEYDLKMMFNELGWRLAWANIRVFADRPLYLARAVDMWRRRLAEVRQDPTEDIGGKFGDWLKLGPPRTAKEEFLSRRRHEMRVESEGEDEVR
ncbi:hypothetical protein SAICODRAFT_32298 [Saitoella complicata NRRL Y-17804]|uniref:DUF8032 domain-containing protein n=1 Tax=Saitoella complicata (strain BCRC 22490 / CBS 7301 / JCM 7358 / NBRC 10748 / NRRL Y-17804) TaxID=698492 RepID=A0A0E9NRW5_SAICN|nr:uncharacterized protein SAICODRAFT_32298 [Saitoella complicata NRRL Y-17804]ODQ49812.1 hypothetical protein SAICODRAFT_32298 [Saitoella complicata NRRL Y-17804]GAO52411.1 hypothetical protein G7K_6489-t1 [Saitoella complicata NRRL Y-17804]